MYKLTRFLKGLRIKEQITWSMIFISILSSMVISATVYLVSKYIIERNYILAHTYNLQVSSNITDIQLNTIIDMARNQLLNEKLMTLLDESNKEEYPKSKRFSSVHDLALTSILMEMAGLDNSIEGITIIGTNGLSKFCYKRIKSGYFSKYYEVTDILKESWVQPTFEAEGKELFYGYDVLLSEDQPYISITKKLIQPFTGKFMGYMVISIRKNLFDKAFGESSGLYSSVGSMIIDTKGENHIVYYSREFDEAQAIANIYITSFNDNKYYLFSSAKNTITGWEMVNIITKKELNKDSAYIGSVIGIVSLFLIAISVKVSRSISAQISKPLSQLEIMIEAVGQGNRHIEEQFDHSEIGEIGTKFIMMVNNNLKLSEELLSSRLHEREAQLQLLQAQINPHFLYNTLDSLYCMAIIDDNDKIANMVSALSNIFKLSLNKGDKLTTLKDEIEHIKAYMEIQNIRYNNRFTLSIIVDESLMSMPIIQFLLQPFVENAMYHGLEPKLGKGSIHITGERDHQSVRFVITDDGIGMEDLSVVEQGYGVKNVRERIRLTYGGDYGVYYESEIGRGTKVTIDIPNPLKPLEGGI